MTKSTSKASKAMPASMFAGPGKSYPVPDKARATQQFTKGTLSAGTRAKVGAKANKKAGRGR